MQVLSEELSNQNIRVFWSHQTADLEGGPGLFVAMQRMAYAAGLAYLDNASHLSFHPKYGPWFSLRCAVVIENEKYVLPQPPPIACPLDEQMQIRVGRAMHVALCAKSAMSDDAPEMEDVRSSWKLWLAVRDTAAPQHPYRYTDEQVLYHYTGDRLILRGQQTDTNR